LHRHDYAELFVMLEGEATFTDGETERTVRAGEIAIVSGGQPHGFANPGPGRLRQIDIHLNERFATTWL
jgi:mannose-6-phosphate isomerase-like protein (cupin superfamily)